jgi:hypothetical protein
MQETAASLTKDYFNPVKGVRRGPSILADGRLSVAIVATGNQSRCLKKANQPATPVNTARTAATIKNP